MDLQMYTYCQAHMYFNWNGTIRVPAVVKYASTLAKFTGQVRRAPRWPSTAPPPPPPKGLCLVFGLRTGGGVGGV